MMKKHNIIPASLWILFIIMITTPLVFLFVPSSRGPILSGIKPAVFSKKSVTLENIEKHSVQDNLEQLAKEHVGFCNWNVRLNNELNYRLFHYSNAQKLILGQHNYFYENIYIEEYLGKDFSGDSIIKQNVIKLKRLQEILDQKGIKLLLVLEPGKVRYMPEYLPKHFLRQPRNNDKTNYGRYSYYCNKLDVNYLDLEKYFHELKPKQEHPFYSQHGIHWSTYGMWVAADTLKKYIESNCHAPLTGFIDKGGTYSSAKNDLDFDLEPPMNLLSSLHSEKIYYPNMQFVTDTNTQHPKALLIADSYVWSLWNKEVIGHWFKDPEFWYYNVAVYPEIWGPIKYPDKKHIKQIIEKLDVIVIMITDANLRNFGWGFIDEATQAFTQASPKAANH